MGSLRDSDNEGFVSRTRNTGVIIFGAEVRLLDLYMIALLGNLLLPHNSCAGIVQLPAHAVRRATMDGAQSRSIKYLSPARPILAG